MQEVWKEANKTYKLQESIGQRPDRQGVDQKGKPPGRQGKGREPDEGGESTNDKKRNTGAGKQAQNTRARNSSKTKSEQQRNPKTNLKREREYPGGGKDKHQSTPQPNHKKRISETPPSLAHRKRRQSIRRQTQNREATL